MAVLEVIDDFFKFVYWPQFELIRGDGFAYFLFDIDCVEVFPHNFFHLVGRY